MRLMIGGMSREHWEKNAGDWAAWATTPGFDSYWSYSPAFFELVPPPRGRTLEVACGEGRVSRDLAARGHHVVAIDSSSTLIRMAREAEPSISCLQADAEALPFPDGVFDLAVFYNSLMDFDDMNAALDEGARVLKRGGALCASITHPLQDAGRFLEKSASSPFLIEGSYLDERRAIDAPMERDGRHMHFKGWAYPLESYSRALERNDLRIEALREPAAPNETLAGNPAGARWQRIPVFLMWRAVKNA